MAITQFTRFGYAYKNQASLTSSFSVHAVTVDSTNSPESSRLPNDIFLESIELEISSIASSADDITTAHVRVRVRIRCDSSKFIDENTRRHTVSLGPEIFHALKKPLKMLQVTVTATRQELFRQPLGDLAQDERFLLAGPAVRVRQALKDTQ